MLSVSLMISWGMLLLWLYPSGDIVSRAMPALPGEQEKNGVCRNTESSPKWLSSARSPHVTPCEARAPAVPTIACLSQEEALDRVTQEGFLISSMFKKARLSLLPQIQVLRQQATATRSGHIRGWLLSWGQRAWHAGSPRNSLDSRPWATPFSPFNGTQLWQPFLMLHTHSQQNGRQARVRAGWFSSHSSPSQGFAGPADGQELICCLFKATRRS